jgi:hypothetical protein
MAAATRTKRGEADAAGARGAVEHVERSQRLAVGGQQRRLDLRQDGHGEPLLGAVERAPGPFEQLLARPQIVLEQAERRQRQEGRTRGGGAGPAGRLGQRERRRGPSPGLVHVFGSQRHERRPGLGAEQQVVVRAPARQPARLLQMTPRGRRVVGPELRDGEVRQREGAQVARQRSVPSLVDHAARGIERVRHVPLQAGAVQARRGGRHGQAPAARRRQARGELAGDREKLVGGLAVARVEAQPSGRERQLGVAPDDPFRDAVQERAQRPAATLHDHAQPVLGERIGGQVPVLGLDGMLDRLERPSVAPVPARRATVQHGNLIGHRPPQLDPQNLQQQRVIAVPRALRVEAR